MDHNSLIPTRESVAQATRDPQGPCISLYQPTHRRAPENRQDLIRYNNLLTDLDKKLEVDFSEAERKKILRPFRELADNLDFWNHAMDGLAILATPSSFNVFTIPRTMPELVVVADSFHKKPLQKFLQSTDQYQILALSLDEMELYMGNRNGVQHIDPGPDVPTTIEEALGRDIDKDPNVLHAYSASRGGKVVLNHGNSGSKDERGIDQERWFRAVDTAVTQHISNRSQLPLVLVALAEHQGEFRRLSQNPLLQEEGIVINPKAIDENQLRDLAWGVMEPKYHARLDGQKDDYRLAHSRGQGSDNLEEVVKAAIEGRIATLFLEEDKLLPGTIDRETGKITSGDISQSGIDDILDDLGELADETGSAVYLVPRDHMPSETGVAAIYRY